MVATLQHLGQGKVYIFSEIRIYCITKTLTINIKMIKM